MHQTATRYPPALHTLTGRRRLPGSRQTRHWLPPQKAPGRPCRRAALRCQRPTAASRASSSGGLQVERGLAGRPGGRGVARRPRLHPWGGGASPAGDGDARAAAVLLAGRLLLRPARPSVAHTHPRALPSGRARRCLQRAAGWQRRVRRQRASAWQPSTSTQRSSRRHRCVLGPVWPSRRVLLWTCACQ